MRGFAETLPPRPTGGMFERFTDRARRVIVLAQEEARLLKHNSIGTEHLLLGLAHEGEGLAGQVLQRLGLFLENARTLVLQRSGEGTSPLQGHIPFTPRSKKALELSLREALSLGHNYISTEHLLLGLLTEAEGLGAQILAQDLGYPLERVREATLEAMGGTLPPETPATPEQPTALFQTTLNEAMALILDRLREIERRLGELED